MTLSTILLLLLVCFATGTCLLSRYLALAGEIGLTELLLCNARSDTYTYIQIDGKGLRNTSLRWTKMP
jgi:hypothetical protein